MAYGNKLFLNLAVLPCRLLNLLPEASSENSPGGWVCGDVFGPCQTAFLSSVLDGRKWSPDDFLRCPHHPQQGLPEVLQAPEMQLVSAALYSSPVEGRENGSKTCSPHPSKKIHVLLGPLYKGSSEFWPSQRVRYLHKKECRFPLACLSRKYCYWSLQSPNVVASDKFEMFPNFILSYFLFSWQQTYWVFNIVQHSLNWNYSLVVFLPNMVSGSAVLPVKCHFFLSVTKEVMRGPKNEEVNLFQQFQSVLNNISVLQLSIYCIFSAFSSRHFDDSFFCIIYFTYIITFL